MSASECEALCKEMHVAKKTHAASYSKKHKAEQVDLRIRKTTYCSTSNKSHIEVTNRVKAIKPTLEGFFNTPLADSFKHPKFLTYGEGDLFSPHTDGQLDRKINITINLNITNRQTDYQGGEHQLYGLINKGVFKNRGIVARSSAGTLIAYPLGIVHKVTPITRGARFCIVSRFLGEL